MNPSLDLNGHTFYVRRLEPFTALKVLGELQKHVLGPASSVLDTGRPGALAQALAAVSDQLDGTTLERLAKLLLNPAYVSVSADGDPERAKRLDEGQVNLTLAGATDALELCLFVAQVNYADFLGKFMAQVRSAVPNLLGTATASVPS